jgi:ubiquitin-protein ligase E3 A
VDAQRRFLRFATGSDRAPPGGLGALKVTVQRTAEPADRLPTAHTCFNYIVLPDYKSKDQLRSKLAKAIELGGEGFGLV